MKRALFGGTFDPPHLGHIRLAEMARAQAELDEVVFIPCHQSPHKEALPQASDADRLEMLRLATRHLPWARISDWELARARRSYSWETAEHFASLNPGQPLYWIMGADQWDALEKWNNPQKLSELLHFIVLPRAGLAPTSKPGWRSIFLRGEIPGSSTGVRRRLQSGGHLSEEMDAEVMKFIRRKGLYGAG